MILYRVDPENGEREINPYFFIRADKLHRGDGLDINPASLIDGGYHIDEDIEPWDLAKLSRYCDIHGGEIVENDCGESYIIRKGKSND